MIIKIDRSIPITQQLARYGIGFAPHEGAPLPPDAGVKVVDEDKRSVAMEKINIDDIVFNLYLGIDRLCNQRERIDYLKKRGKKFIRLDAGIAMALIQNADRIPLDWGRDENRTLVTAFTFDGTIFSESDGNKYVLQVLRDREDNEWTANFKHISDESENPTAVLPTGH